MKRSFFGLVLLAAPLSAAVPASAQTVLLRVVEGESARPSFGALAYLVAGDGTTVKNALTDERGRALFIGIPDGTYRVRVEMIGMATAETEPFAVSSGSTITQELRLESSAIQLEGIEVELDAGRCSVRPGGEGLLVAEIWDEARKALSAASFTDRRGVYRYETMKYDRRLDRNSGAIVDEQQQRREGYMSTPFESRPAEDLIENGFVQRDGRDFMYYAPDATVLLSDPFLDTHCFRIADAGRGPGGLIGLGFEPTGDDRDEPDIAGTMWLDPQTAELQYLEFRYVYLDPEMTTDLVGGRVDFERMPDGSWIVPEWWIRMPIMTSQTAFDGRQRAYIAQYHQTGGLVLDVREAGGRSLGQRAETGGIEGVVLDSLGVALRGVRVGVVGSNQEVFTDAEGSFSITGLTEGRFLVRFVDARLELMGYIPEPVEQDVIRGEMARLEYYMPSIGDVLFEACRGVERDEGSVALAGTVVDALGRGVGGATVRVRWVDYYAVGGGNVSTDGRPNVGEITNGFEATANASGFYHFCGVPPGTRLVLEAVGGEAESGPTELTIADHETGAMRVLQLRAR